MSTTQPTSGSLILSQTSRPMQQTRPIIGKNAYINPIRRCKLTPLHRNYIILPEY